MSAKTELIAFSERLNQALDSIQVPPKGCGRQNIVAQMFNVSQKGARRWLEAEAFPDTARLPSMANKLGVSVEWLMSGLGGSVPIPKEGEKIIEVGHQLQRVPIIAWEETRWWINGTNGLETEKIENIIVSDLSAGSHTFAVKMKGTSMEPVFPEETILIIDPDKNLINRNYVLAILARDNEIVFKQILLDGDKKYLKALSPDFIGLPPILLTPQDQIIGSLVQARLNF